MTNFKLWVDNNEIDHRKYRIHMELETTGLGNHMVTQMQMYETFKEDGKPSLKIFDYSVDLCRAFIKKYVRLFDVIMYPKIN